MTNLSDYLKAAEAADILAVSQNNLRAWAEVGKIPVQRTPDKGYRLFPRTDVDKHLKKVISSRRSQPPPATGGGA